MLVFSKPSLTGNSTVMKNRFAAYLPAPGEISASLVRGCLVGFAGGLIVGSFRWTHNLAYAPTQAMALETPLIWFVFLILAGGLVSFFMERLPEIRSSGIPVVEDMLDVNTPFNWCKILWTKFVGTWLVLLGGLSVGREGPSIEMGAAAGFGISRKLPVLFPRLFPAMTGPHTHGNLGIMAGAGAGLSAAFGAPLGGIAFVVEEMRCHCTPSMLITLITAAFSADLVLTAFGLGPMFPFTKAAGLPVLDYWLLLPLGIGFGLAGAAYNTLLLTSTALYDKVPFPANTRALPPLLLAGVLLFLSPHLLTGGEVLILAQPEALSPLSLVALLLAGKLLFSVLCAASAVPGGLLMPMLCIGGVAGAVILRLFAPILGPTLALPQLTPEYLQLWIILGMSAFFAGSVRAPITGALLTIQMTGAWALTPETIVIALIAGKTADFAKSQPIYEALRGKA